MENEEKYVLNFFVIVLFTWYESIIVDFAKAFVLVPHGRLLNKIANSDVDSKVVVCIREFF